MEWLLLAVLLVVVGQLVELRLWLRSEIDTAVQAQLAEQTVEAVEEPEEEEELEPEQSVVRATREAPILLRVEAARLKLINHDGTEEAERSHHEEALPDTVEYAGKIYTITNQSRTDGVVEYQHVA